MIPYTCSGWIAANGVLAVGEGWEFNVGSLPRMMRVELIHAGLWMALNPAGMLGMETFLRTGPPAVAGIVTPEPLRTYGNYRVLWTEYRGAATDRFTSSEFDAFHEGVILPQGSHLIGGVIAALPGNHVLRIEMSVSGHLLTESLLNSTEATWPSS
jgi:hypothetical protein